MFTFRCAACGNDCDWTVDHYYDDDNRVLCVDCYDELEEKRKVNNKMTESNTPLTDMWFKYIKEVYGMTPCEYLAKSIEEIKQIIMER